MSLGGPTWIAALRLFTSWLIYKTHSQAIKEDFLSASSVLNNYALVKGAWSLIQPGFSLPRQ